MSVLSADHSLIFPRFCALRRGAKAPLLYWSVARKNSDNGHYRPTGRPPKRNALSIRGRQQPPGPGGETIRSGDKEAKLTIGGTLQSIYIVMRCIDMSRIALLREMRRQFFMPVSNQTEPIGRLIGWLLELIKR